MKEQPSLKEGAPLLFPGARVECRPGTSLHVLHLSGGSILVSEGAAAILRLCNGRRSRAAIQLRLMSLGYQQSGAFLNSFLDAARDRRWVVDLKLPTFQLFRVPVCAEY